MITYEKEISIIIPHYNTPRLLKKLLDSIPDIEEIEVIVVDDRSNLNVEEYKECIKKYSNRNICFLANDSLGKGAGVCRNIGIAKAVGKWLLFADADDYFTDNFYEELESYINSDAEIIYFIPTSIELDTGEEGIRHIEIERLVKNYIDESNKKNELELRYRFIQPVCKLIKHELVSCKKIFFDEIMVSNDCMFSVKTAFYANKIMASDKVIYCITRMKGSLTTKSSYDNFKVRLDTYIHYYHFLENNLSSQDFLLLNMHGRGYILRAISNGYGMKEIIQVYRVLHNNKICLFNKDMLNIKMMTSRLMKFIIKAKRENKYNGSYK